MRNVVPIGQTVAEISQFLDFSRWWMPPSWIFKILTFYTQEVPTASLPNLVKFDQTVVR